jgi:hypothetical protein
MALSLAFLGVLGPIGSTLISNGSALLATANALRPLLNVNGFSNPPTKSIPG